MMGAARRTARGLATILAGLTLGSMPAHAQDLDALIQRCTLAGGAQDVCTELAVTGRAIQGQVGFLAGLGSEVSGSAGTLGRRLGMTPRVAVGARAGFLSIGLPDLADPGEGPSRESTFVAPAVHAGLAVGLFDGFSLVPTVGGFFSLDLLAQTSTVFLPTGEGFEGRSTSFSYGVRLGLIRESFTLPGVSVSASRRSVGAVQYGTPGSQEGGAVDVDPTVTSFRATIGKDLLAVGLIVGAGWDRYSGEVTLQGPGPTGPAVVTSSDFSHSRPLVFGGAALNFLVLQLSAEAGWVDGFPAVQGYQGAPFDPTEGSVYASLAFRLTI